MTLSTAAPVIVPTTPSREPSAAAVAAAREPPSSWVRDRSRSLALGRCSVWVSGGAGCVSGSGGGAEPVLGVVRSSAGWCVMFPESVAIVFVRGTNEQEQRIVAVCPLCDSGHPSYRSAARPIPVSGRRGDTLGERSLEDHGHHPARNPARRRSRRRSRRPPRRLPRQRAGRRGRPPAYVR